jgi:hypothetical protein
MKPILSCFPIPELTRISYGEGNVAESLQILKKGREIALANSFEAGKTYNAVHEKTASNQNLCILGQPAAPKQKKFQ